MGHYCKICGQWEANDQWNDEYTKLLEEQQMCFTCNHWRQQLEWDKERGEHNWAVVDGHHYVLGPSAPAESPFKGFEGTISEIDADKGKLKVMVSMFGRETPVELDALQVAKI